MRKAVRAIIVRGDSLLVLKRNKFGTEYYTLPGGGIDMGESGETALYRELREETGVSVTDPRLVFVEDNGSMYGTQYIYLCSYKDGEPALAPDSEEAKIHAMGENLYFPMWLSIKELAKVPFVSTKLKEALVSALREGFPAQQRVL